MNQPKMQKSICPCCGDHDSMVSSGKGYKCTSCNSIIKEPLYILEDIDKD